MALISFSGRHFKKDMILQSVRWYLAYTLSYRDIEEMMKERGISVDHSTIATLGRSLFTTIRASLPSQKETT